MNDLINIWGCSVVINVNYINHDRLDSFSSSFSFSRTVIIGLSQDHDYDCELQRVPDHQDYFFELIAKESSEDLIFIHVSCLTLNQ